jgi:hypothetical protein
MSPAPHACGRGSGCDEQLVKAWNLKDGFGLTGWAVRSRSCLPRTYLVTAVLTAMPVDIGGAQQTAGLPSE